MNSVIMSEYCAILMNRPAYSDANSDIMSE